MEHQGNTVFLCYYRHDLGKKNQNFDKIQSTGIQNFSREAIFFIQLIYVSI